MKDDFMNNSGRRSVYTEAEIEQAKKLQKKASEKSRTLLKAAIWSLLQQVWVAAPVPVQPL